MDKSNEIVCEILGEGHPVVEGIKKGEPITAGDVFAAVAGMILAEVEYLRTKVEELEDKCNG
jgi:hypothetical protein